MVDCWSVVTLDVLAFDMFCITSERFEVWLSGASMNSDSVLSGVEIDVSGWRFVVCGCCFG